MKRATLIGLSISISLGIFLTYYIVNNSITMQILIGEMKQSKPRQTELLSYDKDGYTESDGEFEYHYAFVEEQVWIPGGSTAGINLQYILSKFSPTTNEQELQYELMQQYSNAANDVYKKSHAPTDVSMYASIHQLEVKGATFLDGRYKKAMNGVSAEEMTLANYTRQTEQKVGRAPEPSLYVNEDDNEIDGPMQITYADSAREQSPKFSSDIRAPNHNGSSEFDIYYMPDSLAYIAVKTTAPWANTNIAVLNPMEQRAIYASTHNRGSIRQQVMGLPYRQTGQTYDKFLKKENSAQKQVDSFALMTKAWNGAAEKYGFVITKEETMESVGMFLLLKNGWYFEKESAVTNSRVLRRGYEEYFDKIFPEAKQNGLTPIEFMKKYCVKSPLEATGYSAEEMLRIYDYDSGPGYQKRYPNHPFIYYAGEESDSYVNKTNDGRNPKQMHAWDVVGMAYVATQYFRADLVTLDLLKKTGAPSHIDGVELIPQNIAQIKSLGNSGGSDGHYETRMVKKLISKEAVVKQETKSPREIHIQEQAMRGDEKAIKHFNTLLTYIENPPKGETKQALFRTYEISGAPYIQVRDVAGMIISLENIDTIMSKGIPGQVHNRNKDYLAKKDGTPYTPGTPNEQLMHYGRRIADCVALVHIVRNRGYCQNTVPYIQGYMRSGSTKDVWYGEGNIKEYKTTTPTGQVDSSVYTYYTGSGKIFDDSRLRPGDLVVYEGHGYIIFGRANQDGELPSTITRTGHSLPFKKGQILALESGNKKQSGITTPWPPTKELVVVRPLYSDYIREVYNGEIPD